MKAPFFIPGTMTTHSALSSTLPGMPLSGAAMISSNDFAASAKRSRSFSAPETPLRLRHTIATTMLALFIARSLLRSKRWGLDYPCSQPGVKHVERQHPSNDVQLMLSPPADKRFHGRHRFLPHTSTPGMDQVSMQI